MDEFNDRDIATLLRLKRYEQPPPGYFDNFLHEFHRRQRAELLKQPLWRIAVQRVQDFMFQLNVSTLTSYPAAATAVVVCAAVLSLKVYQAPDAGMSNVASVRIEQQTPLQVANKGETWSLSSAPVSTRDFGSFRNVSEGIQTHRATAQPRYVLDSTPVSYEPSLRF
jgi:hypothetical protein